MALTEGHLIGDRYRLVRRIAVGGMGEVWEAADLRLGRAVAIKVLKAELGRDPEFLERFRFEARTTASINHRNIAAVHDYGEDVSTDGLSTAYLVMELVHGEPLSTRLATRGRLGPVVALDLLEQCGRALQAAHGRGYVHRDVKPGNILLADDGTAKLTDFGIAKAANSATMTRAGMVMGTAHYIAPEQARGEDAGSASDVYALGVVGYECLAGHRPFRAENTVTVAMMHINDPLPPLPPDVPANVRALIEAALVKNPARRYRDGAEFAAAVAAVRRGQPPPAPAATGRAAGPVHPRPVGTENAGHTSDGLAVAGLAAPGLPPLPGNQSGPRSRPLPVPTPRNGRYALTLMFVLLTVAAVIIGVMVVRNAVRADGQPAAGQLPAPAAASPPTSAPALTSAPAPASGSSAPSSSAPNGTVQVALASYAGRPATSAMSELQSAGLRPQTRTTSGQPPRTPSTCSVTDVTPTGPLPKGTAVTVTCQQR